MIAIIAEKPSVALDIARVVGANEKHGGYLLGRGYIVTWALGHLLGLAPPEAYGRKRGSELPIIPEKFKLEKRDKSAARQLGVIRRTLEQCESVVCATDAGREGELIFRRIYAHLGCKLPVKRLWISSLTDEAIEKGLRNMRDSSDYDRLFMAAECLAKADWLVGMNASRALAAATGDANSSLGRVQTPTLAMIAARYLEHRNFLSSDYWSLSVTIRNGGAVRRFRCTEDFKTEPKDLRLPREAIITRVERRTIHEQPPLLYDLTELQKDCNTQHEMSAEKTLEAAQSLYEKRLISYPRTSSRYISPDITPQIPSLLRMILRMEQFTHLAGSIDPLRTSRRSIDASKVTDHHALIITGNYVREPLTTNEQYVYEAICGRMLESFAPRCEKETLSVDATIGEMSFRSNSTKIISAGWRAVYNLADELDNDGAHETEFVEGETLQIVGHSISALKTRPRPIHTEATLLASMEDSALGTPATRAVWS